MSVGTVVCPQCSANAELEKILRANLSGIETAFASGKFVEITREALVVHE
jgi:hypothetical protein